VNAFRAKPVDGPEDVIQRALVNHLKLHDWYVKVMHGTAFQSGLPDLFCTHVSYGMRWVEVKVPVGGKFTRAQYVTFPKLVEHGTPVWILTGPHEYQALFSD